jgi:hypothetical protein
MKLCKFLCGDVANHAFARMSGGCLAASGQLSKFRHVLWRPADPFRRTPVICANRSLRRNNSLPVTVPKALAALRG